MGNRIDKEPVSNLLPDSHKEAQVVLASTSLYMITTFEESYGVETINIGPKNEPLKGGSRRAATAKNNEIARDRNVENGTEIVLSADVVFVWKGKKRHRPDRKGIPDVQVLLSLVEEAVARYRNPFDVTWKVTFATTELPKGRRRLSTFEITGSFPSGLPQEEIEANVVVNSNALVRLVELGEAHGATFQIRRKESSTEYELDPHHAVQLIRDKVLPPKGLEELLSKKKEATYTDKEGHNWGVVPISILNLFGETRGTRV